MSYYGNCHYYWTKQIEKKIKLYNRLTRNNIIKEYDILEDPRWKRDQFIGIRAYDLNIVTIQQLKEWVTNYTQTISLFPYNKIESKIQEFLHM